MRTQEQRAFHNYLRILRSIDRHEVPDLSDESWLAFRDAPVSFVLRCSDWMWDHIWAAMEKRL